MYSPKRQPPSDSFLQAHLRLSYNIETLPVRQTNAKKQQYETPLSYDRNSLASTYDSHKGRLYNISYSDTNILRSRRHDEYPRDTKALDSDRRSYRNMKQDFLNNTVGDEEKSGYSDLGLNTPRESRDLDKYREGLKETNQWGFVKKHRKNSEKCRVQENLEFSKYDNYKKKMINSEGRSKNSKQVQTQDSRRSDYDEIQETRPKHLPLVKKSSFALKQKQEDMLTSSNFGLKEMTIQDFELGRCIGKGTYGNVYVARLKSIGTLFALKKISKQIVIKNKMESQLILEVKLQMYLSHPNILKLYHFFSDSSHIYLIMEYMEEGSLFDSMQKKTSIFTEKETAEILIDVASAVTYLHDIDIVHRDIKPENIVISNGVRKLCDFGWATLCTSRRSTYCGTFDYAAPEILEGKHYDSQVDLWCLGVLTYQLLTGNVPFYHSNRQDSIAKIINSDKQKLFFPFSISSKCRNFVESLMRKQPQQRLKADGLHNHPYLSFYMGNEKPLQ